MSPQIAALEEETGTRDSKEMSWARLSFRVGRGPYAWVLPQYSYSHTLPYPSKSWVRTWSSSCSYFRAFLASGWDSVRL